MLGNSSWNAKTWGTNMSKFKTIALELFEEANAPKEVIDKNLDTVSELLDLKTQSLVQIYGMDHQRVEEFEKFTHSVIEDIKTIMKTDYGTK